MLVSNRLGLSAAAAVAIALLWLAVPAQAAQRFASPGGGGDCSALAPCSLQIALETSPGDEVIVEPGTYNAATELIIRSDAIVHGRPGAPRPLLITSSPFGIDVRPGAILSDFEVRHTGTNIALYQGGTADRVFVQSTSGACALTADGATILNSVCFTTGLNAFAVLSAVGSSVQVRETGILRNVTAYAQDGTGVVVSAGDNAELVIRATNVSAYGNVDDVMTRVSGTQGARSATVILDHSIFEFVNTQGGGLITPPGSPTNLEDDPSLYLVDVLTNDFHQTPGAPTIDAGVTSPANGPLDLDGRARAQGGSTDIGAYEVPVAGPSQGPGGAGAGTSGGVSADKVKPIASKLDVQPDAFAALSGRGASLISAKRKAAKGATVKYRLSEAATVTFTVERAVRGRRKKGKCVSGRRKGRICTRYKTQKGSFTHAGAAGANSLRFSGRLARKPLRPGSYRLVGTARDAAGNKSNAVRTSFRIVRG